MSLIAILQQCNYSLSKYWSAAERSADYEKGSDGKQVLAFRGDCINDIDEKNRSFQESFLCTEMVFGKLSYLEAF